MTIKKLITLDEVHTKAVTGRYIKGRDTGYKAELRYGESPINMVLCCLRMKMQVFLALSGPEPITYAT